MSDLGLRAPSNDDYGLLAWMLRSRPKFQREQTVTEWVWAVLAPRERPDNPDAVRAAIAETAQNLAATFDEFSKRWSAFNYFEYASKANEVTA